MVIIIIIIIPPLLIAQIGGEAELVVICKKSPFLQTLD